MSTGRSRIYAPRVKGDLDLGLENARVKQTGLSIIERDWSRITTPGGLLPGRVEQDIHEATDGKNYRFGTRMVLDERVFRYAFVNDEGPGVSGQYGNGLFTKATTLLKTNPDIIEGLINTNKVTLDMGGVVAEDAYEGGYFGVVDVSVGGMWGARILGNDGSTPAPANYVTFYLEALLPFTIDPAPGGDTVSVTPSPWASVNGLNTQNTYKRFVVGVSPVYYPGPGGCLFKKYMWLQTWGPFPQISIANAHGGNVDFERALYFWGNGAVNLSVDATGLLGTAGAEHAWGAQKAGYYMTDGTGGALTQPVIWLTIAP